ncbi:MAG: type II toxin-antitoxin system VapC family toxin [Patescibacteria group bacterium]
MDLQGNSIIVDSNVIIAANDPNDSDHEHALFWADKIKDKTIYLHQYIVQEVATVLCYKFGTEVVKDFLENVLNSENIILPFSDINKEMEFFLKLNKKISFADATLIKISKEKGIPLLTFDKQIISILRNLK